MHKKSVGLSIEKLGMGIEKLGRSIEKLHLSIEKVGLNIEKHQPGNENIGQTIVMLFKNHFP